MGDLSHYPDFLVGTGKAQLLEPVCTLTAETTLFFPLYFNKHFWIYLFYFIWMEFFVCMYVCAAHACLVSEGVRRTHQSLKLQIQMVMSPQEGPGNQTQVLCRSIEHS